MRKFGIIIVVLTAFGIAGCSVDSGNGSNENALAVSFLELSLAEGEFTVLGDHSEPVRIKLRNSVTEAIKLFHEHPDAVIADLEDRTTRQILSDVAKNLEEPDDQFGQEADPFGIELAKVIHRALGDAPGKEAQKAYDYSTVLADPPTSWSTYSVADRKRTVRRFLREHPKFTAISAASLFTRTNEQANTAAHDAIEELFVRIAKKKQSLANQRKRDARFTAAYKRLIDNQGAIGMTIDQVVDQIGRYGKFQRIGDMRFYYYGDNQLVVENGVITQVNVY